MNTPISATSTTTRLLPDGTRMGAVHLSVTNDERALAIWRDVVGLTLISRDDTVLRLGIGDRVLIVLYVEADRPAPPRSLGLYHVAIHVPTRADLARLVTRAMRAGLRIGPTDHLVTEAVYLWDHDGLGIEITFETPWRGAIGSPVKGAYATTSDGEPHSGREPLDLADLMNEIRNDATPDAALPEGTRIGHVHVHVNDLDRAMRFYAGTLGFETLVMMRDWGMGDAGLGYMPHAVAFNIWSGMRARQPPADAARLKWFEIEIPAAAKPGIISRLTAVDAPAVQTSKGIETADHSGNRICLVFA